jgi:predicted HNH restriction endonuclease
MSVADKQSLKRKAHFFADDEPAVKRVCTERTRIGVKKSAKKEAKRAAKKAKKEALRKEIEQKLAAISWEEEKAGKTRPSLFDDVKDKDFDYKLHDLYTNPSETVRYVREDLQDEPCPDDENIYEFEDGIRDAIDEEIYDRAKKLTEAVIKHKKPKCHVCGGSLKFDHLETSGLDSEDEGDQIEGRRGWRSAVPDKVILQCKNWKICCVTRVEFGS